ncbi:TELO2-interacting protein 1 homolog [Penaeus indicus]|uniref:TELO2-interacting protein 1 homolog n=1 Tax=Penaeus indicus TaxID=29960 RepID=UPI00300C97C7
MNRYKAFDLLKPASVAVAREGDVRSVKGLREAVRQVVEGEREEEGADGWTSCINDLKEYLVFPLLLHLKSGKNMTWSLQEEIVECLRDVLRFSIIEEFQFFQELFTQMFIILTDRGNPQKVRNVSEDCKQAALATVSIIVDNTSNDVKDRIYGDVFRPQLGHAVFICLKLAQEEKNRSLRIEAIETLSALGQKKNFEMFLKDQQMAISQTFSNFLPGIVMALAKIATGDEKQGHKLTVVAITTWIHFVTVVMRDSFLEEQSSSFGDNKTVTELKSRLFGEGKKSKKKETERKKNSKFDLPEPDEETNSHKLPNIEISNDWIQGTADKLMILVQSMAKLVTHPHWKVRLSLVDWAQQIICKCSRSLEGSLVMAIEVIVTLRSDDEVEVGSAAQEALVTITQVLHIGKNQLQGKQQGLMELLEEKVYTLSSQLPTIFRQEDDVKSLTSLRQLLGCLEVLGERLNHLVMWPIHSQRLFRALTSMLTLDTREADLLLEKTNTHDPFEVLSLKPTLGQSFRYFTDRRIFETLTSTCRLIGCHSDVKAVTDLCLDLLQETTQHQKEVLLLLALIIQGRDRRKWKEKDKQIVQPEENENVVQSVIDLIVCQEIFDAALYVHSQGNDEDTIKDFLVPVNTHRNISVDLVKNNVVLVANALNLISACAHMVGPDFVMFLSKVLCPVMEKAGESNVLVGHTACNTLKEIAKACEFGSISELIEKCVPHFWYPLSMRLKRLPQYPSAPLVLQVCLEYANVDVMAFTEELVEDVLLSCDMHHSTQALPLLKVLLVYVMAVKKYEAKQHVVDEKEKQEDHSGSAEKMDVQQEFPESSDKKGEVANFLLNYHRTKMKVQEGLEADSDEVMQEDVGETFKKLGHQEEQMEDDHTVNDEKKKIPRYIELVVRIMETCSYMLYTKDRQIKLLILEISRVGSEALTHWEDERLPVLHKLWKPLVLRLKDSDFVVLMRAFLVLSTMMITSSEFLQKRTIKEVFPPLYSFLNNQSKFSHGKSRRSGYYMTMAYKAQYAILDRLGMFVNTLNLRVFNISELLNVMVIYLETKQPPELTGLSLEIVKQIANKHPNKVWLLLAYQQPPMRIIPPVPSLPSVKISGSASSTLITDATNLYKQLS